MKKSGYHHERGLYIKIYVLLLILLVLSMLATFLPYSFVIVLMVCLLIAVIKTFFIMSIFMHLKDQGRLVKLYSFAGILWLLILIHFTMNDYATR